MKKIIIESNIVNDEYTDYVYNAYDIQNREKIVVEIPLNLGDCKNKEWEIGLIVGNSGSGKSTILKELGDIKEPTYNYEKAIISNFNFLSPEEVCSLFTSVGLSSVPTWLHKPHELSNGERARLDLAWQLANGLSDPSNTVILYDEFTSTINRSVAQSMAYCVQKFIRKHHLRIILASCHYDIIDWLNPDWIYNLNKEIDGVVEVEWQIYKDDKEYELYKQIDNKIMLSDVKEI